MQVLTSQDTKQKLCMIFSDWKGFGIDPIELVEGTAHDQIIRTIIAKIPETSFDWYDNTGRVVLLGSMPERVV